MLDFCIFFKDATNQCTRSGHFTSFSLQEFEVLHQPLNFLSVPPPTAGKLLDFSRPKITARIGARKVLTCRIKFNLPLKSARCVRTIDEQLAFPSLRVLSASRPTGGNRQKP